ncbi:MAG: phosphate transport system permease protein [Saprospiraceae bacterium]|jgi:phosphate transport system permease protein
MTVSALLLVLLALTVASWMFARQRASLLRRNQKLHSLPRYHGNFSALWCALPALVILILWTAIEPTVINGIMSEHISATSTEIEESQVGLIFNQIQLIETDQQLAQANEVTRQLSISYQSLLKSSNLYKTLLTILVAIAGALISLRLVKPHFKARNSVETIILGLLVCASSIAILTTVGIVMSVLFESIRFFQSVPITDFLFGTHWSPQTAIRANQVGSTGSFGAIPLLAGTFLIALIALFIAVPFGLMSAIYLSEYASPTLRSIAKPGLEVLAGIPTVVYGFFAALTVGPFIRNLGESIGLNPSSESALVAGLVMGVMIIPFVSSLSDDVINAVPQSLRDGSYALGSTKSETIKKVIIPAALPGIVGSIILAASRAIGETMIVVMAAGLTAKLTANPLESVTTVTVQIVTLLTGDQEFDSPKTLAAFALGLLLFVITLLLNMIALHVVRKYREEYE